MCLSLTKDILKTLSKKRVSNYSNYLILPTCQEKEPKRSVTYFTKLNTFVLLTV